jgi:hypothetical protein
MIDCIVTVLMFSISDDEFCLYIHISLEDTLNMNMKETYNCILQILLLFLHHPEVPGSFQPQNQFEKQLKQKASTFASEIDIRGY